MALLSDYLGTLPVSFREEPKLRDAFLSSSSSSSSSSSQSPSPVESRLHDLLSAASTRTHPQTAAALFQAGRKRKNNILTLCSDLDHALGGGVRCGEVTEFCGEAGIGKTQMAMQIAIDATLPKCFGGIDSDVVYIDTEGSFIAERAHEMASGLTRHLQAIVNKRKQKSKQHEVLEAFTPESILARITVFRVHSAVNQIAIIKQLPTLLKNNPKIRSVVVDSIAFHFRGDNVPVEFAEQSRLLGKVANDLNRIAVQHDVAVVLINQMTSKLDINNRSILVPALGSSWQHACTTRILLQWKDLQCRERVASLVKSPWKEPDAVEYLISRYGVRGLNKHKRKHNRVSEK